MKKKYFFLAYTIIFFSLSCKNKPLIQLENELFSVTCYNAKPDQNEHNTTIDKSDTHFNAKFINIKELFMAIAKVKKHQVRVADAKFLNRFYAVNLNIKNTNTDKHIILDSIAKYLNFSFVLSTKVKYEIVSNKKIKKSFLSRDPKSVSTVVKKNDSMIFKNCNLQHVFNVLSSHYGNDFSLKNTNNRYDIALKLDGFNANKQTLERQLGLQFSKIDSLPFYTISKKLK